MKNEIEEKRERLFENEKVFDLFSYFFKKMQGHYYSCLNKYKNNNNNNYENNININEK
jgi:hypothetical protein